MHVAIVGGTGLVGRHTAALLRSEGHEVTVVSRTGGDQQWDPKHTCTVRAEAIVNLAGASIGKRWSRRYKRELLRSRLQTTTRLAAANPNAKWVQASAVGYYGRNPEGTCTERRGPGDDFLANLAAQWERAAPRHATILRFGHVLDAEEGFLARLRPIYNFRLGGPIAGGKQGLPWVHVHDVARAISWALQQGEPGPYNVVSPESGTQKEFNDGLAAAMQVKAVVPMPAPMLRVAVGELSKYLVGGQHAPPKRLLQEGFEFQFPNLGEALADVLAAPNRVQLTMPLPPSSSKRRHMAKHEDSDHRRK